MGERCIDRDEQVTNLVKLETFLYSRNYSRRTTKVQSSLLALLSPVAVLIEIEWSRIGIWLVLPIGNYLNLQKALLSDPSISLTIPYACSFLPFTLDTRSSSPPSLSFAFAFVFSRFIYFVTFAFYSLSLFARNEHYTTK